MNTKFLMITSAVILGIMGLGLTFLPEEIAKAIGTDTNKTAVLILQILGSLYVGFALLNWMSRHSLIGGIYSKPLLIGNFVHFLVTSIALIKFVMHFGNKIEIITAITVIYIGLTLAFGYVFRTNPSTITKSK